MEEEIGIDETALPDPCALTAICKKHDVADIFAVGDGKPFAVRGPIEGIDDLIREFKDLCGFAA